MDECISCYVVKPFSPHSMHVKSGYITSIAVGLHKVVTETIGFKFVPFVLEKFGGKFQIGMKAMLSTVKWPISCYYLYEKWDFVCRPEDPLENVWQVLTLLQVTVETLNMKMATIIKHSELLGTCDLPKMTEGLLEYNQRGEWLAINVKVTQSRSALCFGNDFRLFLLTFAREMWDPTRNLFKSKSSILVHHRNDESLILATVEQKFLSSSVLARL